MEKHLVIDQYRGEVVFHCMVCSSQFSRGHVIAAPLLRHQEESVLAVRKVIEDQLKVFFNLKCSACKGGSIMSKRMIAHGVLKIPAHESTVWACSFGNCQKHALVLAVREYEDGSIKQGGACETCARRWQKDCEGCLKAIDEVVATGWEN